YAAVRIEEPAGRAEYARRQREFAARGQALRVRLLAMLDAAVGAAPGTRPDTEWTSSARP
ncbi:3-methyladenine DNA glycosylase, partial [Xanthomonas citri pv. citri]|nr:3-methyladenine DNA glycosylase [Xanthomonas citri pv. citri]